MRSPSPPRILFLQPPTSVKIGASFSSSFPLGLALLASYLEKCFGTMDIAILDATAERYQQIYPDGSGKREIHGMTDDEIKARIRDFAPLIVGVSCAFSNQHSICLKMAKLAKEVDPRILTVLGGVHASAAVHEVMQVPEVDVVVRGPAEKPLADLISCIMQSGEMQDVRGIAFRRNGEIFVTPGAEPPENLDDLPFPDLTRLPIDLYARMANYSAVKPTFSPAIPIHTSRGCPHKCVFCYSGFWGNSIKYRSLANVFDEVNALISNFGVRELHIVDDNFGGKRSRTLELLDGLTKMGIRKVVPINGSPMVSLQDPAFLDKLQEIGVTFLRVYIESGHSDTLKKMRKPHSVAVVDKVISLARKKGFLLYGSYMLGFPWQTIEDMLTEVSLAKTLDVDYWSFNTVAAFPGTDLFAFCKRHGFLADNVTFDDLSLYSGNIATPSFSTHDVERICKEAFIEINFASKEKIRRAAEIFGVPVEEIERRKERAQFFLNNPQEGEP